TPAPLIIDEGEPRILYTICSQMSREDCCADDRSGRGRDPLREPRPGKQDGAGPVAVAWLWRDVPDVGRAGSRLRRPLPPERVGHAWPRTIRRPARPRRLFAG